MTQPPSAPSRPTGWATSLLLRLLVPADRREEFEGDLLEERAERARLGQRTEGFVWRQLLRSAPGLLAHQARRSASGSGPGLLAIAVPVSVALMAFAGVFQAPLGGAVVLACGVAVNCLGLFALVPSLRTAILALGTATLLVGQALCASQLNDSILMLYIVPGYFLTFSAEPRARCGRRRRTA